MKKHHAWILYLALGAYGASGAKNGAPPVQDVVAAATTISKPQIVERGNDHRVWQQVVTTRLDADRVAFRTNRWVDLASGMHYWDKNQWKESRANISVTDDGAEAREGPHKVHFLGNINTVGAITITSRDNKTLRAHVLGLAYTDLATGNSVLIAQVRDSFGQLFPPNQVVYSAAFSGLLADVRYTYTRDSFEQDVILRENPAPPSAYGLNNETTALEVWTEFVEAPEPNRKAEALTGLSDETLSFGKLRMVRGRAFALDTPIPLVNAAPVGKTWLKGNGRQILIESVLHRSVATELEKLPQLNAALPAKDGSRLALINGIETSRPLSPQPVRMASARSPFQSSRGLVLDFVFIEGEYDDYTFQGDLTYLISGEVHFDGLVTFEGGTVIKIATTNNAFIHAWSDVITKTAPYRPAIFTSQNDSSVGEDLSSSGTPLKYFGALVCGDLVFEHVRISNARYGLHTSNLKLRHAQFVNCDMALVTDHATAEVDNVLMSKVGTAFGGLYFRAEVRHATVNQCTNLGGGEWGGLASSSIALTNCLLVNITTNGVVPLTTNYTVTTTNNIFQTVGAGGHYLSPDSPYRDSGTTILPAALAADLKKLTTYPPIVYSNAVISTPITLCPQAPRDTDVPDLGYHYDPLDYAFGGTDGNTNFTFAAGTAVGWFRTSSGWYHAGHGLHMADRQVVTFDGRAESPCYWARCSTVQEGTTGAWDGGYGPGGITGWADQYSYDVTRSPEINARFTKFSVLSADGHMRDDWGYLILRANNCEFSSGSAGGYIMSIYLTNCLAERVGVGNGTGWPGAGIALRNCTFRGGSFGIDRYAGAMPVSIRDSVFDETAFSVNDSYASNTNVTDYAYNAFLTWGQRTTPTNAHDVLTGYFDWQAGSLGAYYILTNSLLINAGSQNATNAGLYHYTMLTNNVKETNTTVDIGFHYVATDANGTPLDYDGDGIPDYVEDANGNGSYDAGAGETDWKAYTSPNGLALPSAFRVYTPLK